MANRHRLPFIAALTLGAVAPAMAQTLVWSDEFEGPTIDRSTWTYNVGTSGFGNGELQYHTARPENASIENGELVIEARDETYLNALPFTSSRLVTHGRFAFKYGTLEARIRVPDVDNGLWPAFWLLGNNIGQVGWPACGELDILEVGNKAGFLEGVVNRRVDSHAFWDFQGSQADFGEYIVWPEDLYLDYHVYKMEWTPEVVRTFVDDVLVWEIDISDIEGPSLEEFHAPMFIIANVSVGGWNFVEITDPNQITAPFPGRMYIDYVRLYDNGDTELYFGEGIEEDGAFGVFTETVPVENALTYESDASLYLWNNLSVGPADPFEGGEAWNMTAAPGDWFGMGVFTHADRNMRGYSDGHLHLHMKTTSPAPFRLGIKSSAAGESWVDFPAGQGAFGLERDGEWHEVVIPLNAFLNVDFATIGQMFMIAGDPPAAPFQFSIDNVYWSPSVPRETPENGSFGIFTEDPAHKTAGDYALGVDGEFYIWESTLLPTAQDPYEGSTSMSLTSTPGSAWFGAAFTPTIKYDLTAFRYPQSRMHVALKTNSPAPFYIGMRSGNVNDIGQKWIRFEPGNDPHGFVRNGQWQVIEIPMADFADAVDLSEVSMLFQLLGVDGPIGGIEFDDVCLLGGGDPISGGPIPGDCDGSGGVDSIDLNLVLANFGTAGPEGDCDGSGSVDSADLNAVLANFGM